MERGVQSKAITVVIENSVTVCIAPWVFVNIAIAIVVVADVVVGERDDLELHHGDGVRHPLSGVVVADNHDVVALRIVSIVANKWIVIAVLNVGGDLHPW